MLETHRTDVPVLSMGKTYRPYLPEQDLLLPPSLRDWLPEGHLAYFVSDLIDELNLSAIESYYEQEERGYPPYHPRMMTKILVYGYCVGVFSSRRLQKRLHEDIAFRVLAADNQPDFRTLSDFRKIHLATLQGLFEQVLRMAVELGALKLGRIAIDGSKLKANASKHKAMSYKRMKEEQKRLKQEVRRLLEEAERIDAEEDARYGRNRYGDELPAELQRREERLQRIREAKRALEARARQEAEAAAEKPDGECSQTEVKPEENQAGFQLLFLGKKRHVASCCLFRSVQFPCRLSVQVIDSSWLCRLCIEHHNIICCLFIIIYDIFLILSEAEEPATLNFCTKGGIPQS